MSLLDNSKASQLQASCWRDIKERRAKRICLKCGIIERCYIDKEYHRDGETIKRYFINSSYEYIENTLQEGEQDICKRCIDRMLSGKTSIGQSNRLEADALLREIEKGLWHDLYKLISPKQKGSIPAVKRQANNLLLEKQFLEERMGKRLPLDKQQKEFLANFDTGMDIINAEFSRLKEEEKRLMKLIDEKINRQ